MIYSLCFGDICFKDLKKKLEKDEGRMETVLREWRS